MGSYVDQQRLLRAIESLGINTDVIPSIDSKTSLNVSIGLTAIGINYDETAHEFTLQGWFTMEWTDPRLAWSPEEYGNITTIRLSKEKFWIPDLIVYNGAAGLDLVKNQASPIKAYIRNEGVVLYIPLITWVTHCKPNLLHWPYDTTSCSIDIGSWTFSTKDLYVNLRNESTPTLDTSNVTIRNWKLLSTSTEIRVKKYDCCVEDYQTASFRFEIQRASGSRHVTIFIPIFVTAVLALLTCFIPPMSSSKLLVGMVQLLLISGHLIYFDSILAGSETTPLIVLFYGFALCLVTLSLVASVATFSWMSYPKSSPPPDWVTRILSSGAGRLLGVQSQVFGYQLRDGEKNSENDQKNAVQKQWLSLSCAVHRFIFFVYFLFFIVLISKCLSQ